MQKTNSPIGGLYNNPQLEGIEWYKKLMVDKF
jgi:hypothetical protein